MRGSLHERTRSLEPPCPGPGSGCRLAITVSRTLLKKLAAARDALSHSHPGASEAEIIEAGLDLLLERHARRSGLVKKPRSPTIGQESGGDGAPKGRYIPAHVRREVWKRDDGRCQWPLEATR